MGHVEECGARGGAVPCEAAIEKKPGASVQKKGGGNSGGSQRAGNDVEQLGERTTQGISHMSHHLTSDVSGPSALTTGLDASHHYTNYGYLIYQKSTYACVPLLCFPRVTA